MTSRTRLWLAAVMGVSIVAGLAGPSAAPASAGSYREITDTGLGRSMAAAAAKRRSLAGIPIRSSRLRVWELGPDDHLVGERFPANLRVSSTKNDDGTTTQTMSFVAKASGARPRGMPPSATVAAASASWGWVDQACFSRRGSTTIGWLDVCYAIHRLNGETDTRDFYQLEQYGTLGAGVFTKMYRGSLETTKAPGSSPMSWIDWSPRSNHSGSCTNLNLIVKALGISITSPAEFCESVTPTKHQAAGHLKVEWSCGCIPPFGQPYPNTRELDAMQAISVPGGGRPSWTLGYAYTFL